MCRFVQIVLPMVVLVALACPATATVVYTSEAQLGSVTGAGVITPPVFSTIPELSNSDYADASQGHGVTVSRVEGTLHGSTGPMSVLTDGLWPATDDSAGENVFFNGTASTDRLEMDLRSSIAIQEVNVYSRHGNKSGARTPQLYDLYGTNTAGLSTSGNLVTAGWSLIAQVSSVDVGSTCIGVIGTHVYNNSTGGSVGTYQYLLFDVFLPKSSVAADTFYSEIDVVQSTPEPGTLVLLATGLIGLLAYAWRRRR
jgi:hypothetical protein